MRSFWSDPYLWIHLAGLAALPIFLELCLVGLAVGDPLLPVWLELLLIAVVGIAPILWMQWQQPFYIFSVVAVALKPEQLTDDQRRLLTLFKADRNRVLAVLVAIVLFVILRQVYDIAAIATDVVPLPAGWRGIGLLLAAIAFLASNLFFQVPVSVLSVMLTSESTFSATAPHPLEQIRSSFTLLGLPLNQILPAIIAESPPAIATTPAAGSKTEGLVKQASVEVEPQIDAASTPPTSVSGGAADPAVDLTSSDSSLEEPWD